ncbi:MAG: phosphoribosylformylglycinamidine synthase subunit PurL [Thaumarchaeota archaeon]|nr:phosphoribosylformylglycinamidine synthase subunit PurL [Nitrososphaerota archaeon]
MTQETRLGLTSAETSAVRDLLGREPNDLEWAIIDAEWSEHSSYKSSKALLRLFPTTGKRVVLGPGYDAGVVDVGGGYVATLHIESHNHPSAVDPYGGASTGIGGVLRDIISAGSRPIALLDILRFGDPEKSGHSRWLFRNVVRGIADYGNCVGIPTVAGDIEFDESFEKNCLVDVACIGIAKRGSITLGEAKHPGDVLMLVGGSTGRDGVGGAAFASKNLAKGPESDRTSVQVPDPFTKKLLLESLLEASRTGLIRAMKDLGGGGLSTCLSEVASKGGTGVDVELTRVLAREPGMTATEIMTSESQERMLLMLDSSGADPVVRILDKYEVQHSVIGKVTPTGAMVLRWNGEIVADLPAKVVAEAPLIPRESRRPSSIPQAISPTGASDVEDSLLTLLSSPNISSRRWVYEQYDHEVGLRTILKPGAADASLLRLPNGSMLAVKADGNSLQSSLDPRAGAAGCVSEACRNVIALGAEPIAMVDHLQFGDPSDPDVYWTFKESVEGIADYCRKLPVPVVGGKVSFYNEDASSKRAIKPSPIAMVVGLMPATDRPVRSALHGAGEQILILGETRPELGGSEFARRVLKKAGGAVPVPDASSDSRTFKVVRRLVRSGAASAVHDSSRGGLSVALAEMAIQGGTGLKVDIAKVPGENLSTIDALFSESHGRFAVTVGSRPKADEILGRSRVPYSYVGKTGGRAIQFAAGNRAVSKIGLDEAKDAWENTVPRLMQ